MTPPAQLDLQMALLREVLHFAAPADVTVSGFFRKHRALGPRERGLLADTVFDVLRRRLLYQHLAQAGSGPPERRLALLSWQRGGLAPALAQRAASPDEATWLEQAAAVDLRSLPAPMRHNLPAWLAEPLLAQCGEAGFWALVQSLDAAAPLDLRVNPLKARREDVQRALAEAGIAAEPTPYAPWGLRVQGKPALGKLDLVSRGDVEVQDEGSQLLALLVDAKRGEMVVDFCAGAGGKTLALGASMRNTGRLYAFDVSGHRLEALKPRLARSGLDTVHLVQIVHERDERVRRLAGKVDRVLVDAPCSGLGTLRRNPDLKWRQTPKTVVDLEASQRSILSHAAALLKPGGRLIYATCSLLRAENEAIADGFEARSPGMRRLNAATLLTRAQVAHAATLVEGDALRLWPHRHGTDGFFAVAWQKVTDKDAGQ